MQYIDLHTHEIRSVPLPVQANPPMPSAIAVYGDLLYYADMTDSSVRTVNKVNGSNSEIFCSNLSTYILCFQFLNIKLKNFVEFLR